MMAEARVVLSLSVLSLAVLSGVNAASLGHKNYRLQYEADVESTVFDQEQINSTIRLTVEPVTTTYNNEVWYQMQLMHVSHNLMSHHGTIAYPSDALHKTTYFSTSQTGVVHNMYYARDDSMDLVHIKKYMISALSGHLQDNDQDEWDYSLEEVDHAGRSSHHYQARQTTAGKIYHRQKQFNPSLPHIHKKQYIMNHDGILTSVISHEHIILFKDHFAEGESKINGKSIPEAAQKIDSKIHLKLVSHIHLERTETLLESSLKLLINDSIELNLDDDEDDNYQFEQAKTIIADGLKCAGKHGRITSKRAECVMGIRKVIDKLSATHLQEVGDTYLKQGCSKGEKNFENCQHNRDLLIDLIARVGSQTAQTITLKYVLKANDEAEIQRTLFHFTQLEQPTKESVEAVAKLCFGKNMEHHGVMRMHGNQKRACMTLGSMLRRHVDVNEHRTHQLLDHLHTWLQTDRHIDHAYDSRILRDPLKNVENEQRLQFVHAKSVLLHALGNAAQPKSRDHIAVYAEPNVGHADNRHTAMQALRHYTCDQSATLLLNVSMNDEDHNIKRVAHSTYMQHPKAGKLSFTDENILISKNKSAEKHLRAKRSVLCNLIDKLTLEYRLDFPGFQWSKNVGNDFIGADFGVKMINFAHLHLSPVTMFFELNLDNRAWIDSWVTLFKRRNFEIFNAEACFKRAYRMYNLSTTVDFNVKDIIKDYEVFDGVYNEVVQPIIDSVNEYYYLLEGWKENITNIDLGLGIRDAKERLEAIRGNVTDRIDGSGDIAEGWVNDTFGGVMELIDDIQEFKADVINKKNQINDTIQQKKQKILGTVQEMYENAVHTVQSHINGYLQSVGLDVELDLLDECVGTQNVVDIIKDPDQAGEEIVECLKEKLKDAVLDADMGLMGQMNKLLRTVRNMQEKFQNVSNKVEKVQTTVENIQAGGWKFVVKKLLERHQGFIDEMATSMLDFLNGVLDDMGMNLQYLVKAIDEASQFIEKAARLIKDSPRGAITDITRGVIKTRIQQALFDRLKGRFTEMGSEMQGKLASWMESGVDHANLIRGIKQVIKLLKTIRNVKGTVEDIKNAGSPRDKLEIALKEIASIDAVAPLLENLVEDLESIRYLADGYKDSFSRVINGMKETGNAYENLKRGAERAKTLVQKVFGVKFHPAFPKQVKTDCDDNCGGCGIYPNIMRGRRGSQLLAESGKQIVAPFDVRAVPIEGSSDEMMLYPLGADMNDYEIVITFIKPVQQVYDEPEGFFADAGVVIGEAQTSPCQPNFIHVAVRKLNSTVQSESKSQFGVDLSRPPIKINSDETCGSKDLGEYVPCDEYAETPDPEPMFLEGCSKVEFKHIFDFFDFEELADKLQNFDLDFEQLAADIGDKIEKGLENMPEFPDDINWDEVEDMTVSVVESSEKFLYDLQAQVTKPLKNIQYSFDDMGEWRRKISFNFPNNIPKMSDFFDTMNFTVNGFGDFLQKSSLSHLSDKLMGFANDLALKLEENMCLPLSKIKPSKLRTEILKEGGLLSRSKDLMKAQLSELKMKGCTHIMDALSKGQDHFCEVDETSGCNVVECITKNIFDDMVIEIPVGIGFDPCSLKIHIGIGVESVEIEFDEGTLITTVTLSVASINHINITAIVTVEFHVPSKNVTVDVVLKACHTKLPVCFGYSPVFQSVAFEIGESFDAKSDCINFNITKFPCQGGNNQSRQHTKRTASSGVFKNVLDWKMKDFLYSMDRFNISRFEVNNMVETARTSVQQKLSSLTALKTSIQGKEIFKLPDLRADNGIKKGPFDIPFFKIPFKFPPVTITVSAGGVINIGLNFALKILSANASILPHPSIAGFAEADGKCSVVVAAVGLKLKGTLLETIFNLLVDVRWSEYPINIDNTLRVDLIPLGVDFKGYFKVLFIPIEFTIFTWKAPLIEGKPSVTTEEIHDETAPEYEWENNQCLVEQVLGRHWSDPAFFLEAPFYDPESLLHVQYCIGTYQDGTDVLEWTDMEGVSMIVPIQLKVTGIPLHFTVKATNTDSKTTVVRCVLDTYDVTPATGRFEASHVYTSHPSKLSGSLMVIEDSPLIEEQYSGIGVARGYLGDQVIEWYLFDLDKDPRNKEGEGELAYFTSGRTGKLTSIPIQSTKTQYDHECAKMCRDIGDGCASFDYDYNSDACDLHWTIQGKAADLVLEGAYHNFEKLGAGYTAYFDYDGLNLIHGEAYYLNARITNVRGYESYLTTHEIIVDFTTPEPGPIGNFLKDEMRHDNCSAAITQSERCISVTPQNNHRHIIDGPGASTVFNGNYPEYDMLYTISNHYMTANWAGFHDDETDIWGYTWAAGRSFCGTDVQEWDDPHSHLADKSYWTHQGLKTDILLEDGPYYVTVQALNSVVFGGALVTSVCHSTPIIVDTSAPWLDFVEDVFYDEDFDLMGIYYKASDPESGIMRTDIGLGETKHDVFIRAYSRHDPLHDGYEMVSVDGIDLPIGIPVWVRVRVVNNVEMLTADNADQPLMMDPTPPVIGSVLDGDDHLFDMDYQPYDDRMCVQWYEWFDPESGIDRFLWGIGSSPNETDVMGFVEYDHYTRSACLDIPLNHSDTYYNIIKAYNKAINSRASQKSSDGITVDLTEPIAGWVHDGAERSIDIQYSSLAASVYTNWGDYWDPESGIEQYVVTVSVNGEEREVYTMTGEEEYLEDHTLHFQHTDYVQMTVESENGATLRNESQSTGYTVDLTPPDVVFVKDHPQGLKYQVSDSQMYAHWLFEDEESHIKEYRLRVLEHKGKTTNHMWPHDTKYKIFVPRNDRDKEFEETIDNLDMSNGIKYSLEVTAVNKAGLGSKQDSLGVTVDTTPPVMSKIYIGSFGADQDLNDDNEVIHDDHHGIQASWVGYDHESGITKFMVAVGIAEGDTSVTGGFRDFGTEPDGYIDGISLNVTEETGTLYYVSIYAINGAGVQSEVISSTPIHVYGENIPGIVYDGRDVYVDKDYGTDTVTFAVSFQGFDSPACGIRAYEWSLGSKPGYSDILPYSSYGIVMLNESHAITEIHIPLKHGDTVYASVRAHTGHRCSDAILHSCSDGITIDTEPPSVEIVTLGVFGNDTEDDIAISPSLYQADYNSIAFEWNTTDIISGTQNDTWMAGSLPFLDDKHPATITTDTQIPIRAVTMAAEETVFFTVLATDLAGNVNPKVSPPLTVDITEPILEGFICSEFLSPVQSEVSCQWTLTLDHESPIVEQRIAIGKRQLGDDVLSYKTIPHGQYSWKRSLDDLFDILANKSRVFITLQVVNKVGLVTSGFSKLNIDTSPPVVADTYIVTPVTPGEMRQAKICQASTTTMEISWDPFSDRESDIHSYEVAVGSGPGRSDISSFRNVGHVNSVFLDQLVLVPNSQMFASVRAINHARLISGSTSASVYVSPNPQIEVWDGLGDKDIDFQNDLSSISGQVFLSEYCPIQLARWTANDILDNKVVNATEFFNERFANDELRLENFRTYYVMVEMVDAINRTLRGKSDGVMMVLQPPRPGEVRDGPYYGEDRNYQESTSVLSVNWDEFGDENDPAQTIIKYEVAIGTFPAYPETRTDVHYYEDVGLSLNHTFHNLRLTPKRVQYFATVKGYSETGASVESVSNGIWAGYSPGMEAGEVKVARYSSNATAISFYWDRFHSDFNILHYRWALGLTAFADDNVTIPCSELLNLINKWATVQSLVDEKRDTYAEKLNLALEHNTDYYVVTVAEDEASQCIAAPTEMFTIDLTPPEKGKINVEGISNNVQYTTSKHMLRVSWQGYQDKESGITDFTIQLMKESNCTGSHPEKWEPVSEELDVKDADKHTYMALNLEHNMPYRVVMTVINGAGLTTYDWSDPIFLDTTEAIEGVVKDGIDWTSTKHYQSSTTTLEAIFAVSPLGSALDCPLVESLLPPNNDTWDILNDYVIKDNEGNHHKDVYINYQDRNIKVLNEKTTAILFHYNISTISLEGGAMVSQPKDILEGEYTMDIQAPSGEKTIFSLTLSNGWMDEYTEFDLPVVTDPLTDDEFFEVAKSGDIEFDRDLDVTGGTTKEPPVPTTPEPTTEADRNLTEPEYNYRDGFETNAIGLHFLGFPFGNVSKVWMVLFWARADAGIKENWIYLDNDPSLTMYNYKLDVERDMTEADGLWNVYLIINGTKLSEINGINLPSNYTVKMRHWTYNNYIPELVDPFNPFSTRTLIKEFTTPLPKERPCQFGKAFYDMESGVEQIYVGVSNSTSKDDNIVNFHLAHELCHSCELPCDYYKCSDDCNPKLDDGYQMLTVKLSNLTLDPGDFETEEQLLQRFHLNEFSNDIETTNDTAYMSNRYYVLIKTVNEAGLEKITSSPGVKIDVTPPVLTSIEATDPEYDPVIPTAYQFSNNSLAAWWVFEDKESPVWEYSVAVGTSANSTDIYPYISVGLATTVTIYMEEPLDVGQTYYITVKAINAAGLSSFASTNGVTIYTTAPDVSNATSKPIYSEPWPPGSEPGTDDDAVYISDSQDKVGLIFDGTLADNVFKLEWGTGESEDDSFITSPVEIDRREYNWTTLEIRDDGYFYFGGVKSNIHLTWLAQKAAQINMTMDDEYIDPGRIWLEPGRCVHHQLYAQNMAHLRTLVSHTPVCMKRSTDHIVITNGSFELEYEKEEIKVKLAGQGVKGALISTAVDQALYETEYVTSANLSFTSFIVNPKETMEQTSRIMTNRIDTFTERAMTISPAASSFLLQPLEITVSYSGITWDPVNQTLAILYWDTAAQKWYNVEESSHKQSLFNPETEQITGWFSGRFDDETFTKRSVESIIKLKEPHMFGLFIISFNHQNSPPLLINKILVTDANEMIQKQLQYYDADGDLVTFDLISEAEHGLVNITQDGILTYSPDEYYYGWDEINITLTETTVPPGTEPYVVQERIRINVREIPFAPWLFLELAMGLNKTINRWRFFTNIVEVQFEANTTSKLLGTLYVCDLNPSDTLNLTWINIDNENVTVAAQVLDSNSEYSNYFGVNLHCVEKNLKVFTVNLKTSSDYYGYDQIQFIGYDNYTLYSQVVKVDMYTLFSPCGTYGTCTSEHDPDCESNQRAESFEDYQCACDAWHKETFCDILDVLKITFLSIGVCWLTIIVVFGLVKTRQNYQVLMRVAPSDEGLELDEIDTAPDTEDDGNDSVSDESVEEIEVEAVQKMTFDPDAEAPKRYHQEFKMEAWKNWIAPQDVAASAVVASEVPKPTKPKKKKVKKRKTSKKSTKVVPL